MAEYFGIPIVQNPRIFSGRPIVGGHRVTIRDIAVWHGEGESVEEIAEGYNLTTVEVRAALAYYQDHQAEVDKEIAEDRLLIRELAAKHSPELKGRLERAQK